MSQPSSPELPMAAPREAGPSEADLAALPAPPRHDRTVSVLTMAATTLLALGLAAGLVGEARYGLAGAEPADVGELAGLRPTVAQRDTFVRGAGTLATSGATRFSRRFDGDTFRVAPVVGNASLWVELRVPAGVDAARFVPPAAFVGRLVPLASAGLRHRGVGEAVRDATGRAVPEDAWLLVDGATPTSARWALALIALLAAFATWNAVSVLRVLRRVRA